MDPSASRSRQYSPTLQVLWRILQAAGVALVCKIFIELLIEYRNYFPANLESDFLILRADDFRGLYRVAFYVHIITAPLVFIAMTLQLSEWFLRNYKKMHRIIGRCCMMVGIFCVVPSSMYMAHFTFAGWVSTVGFYGGSIGLGVSLAAAWQNALSRNFRRHRIWNVRAYLFMLSAVVLRVIGGITERLDLPQIPMYQFAAWSSWLLPLLAYQWLLFFREGSKSSGIHG